MVNRGSRPHAPKSQPEVKWNVIIVVAFENDNDSELLSAEIKNDKKTIFKTFRFQVFSFFLADCPPNECLLRILIL